MKYFNIIFYTASSYYNNCGNYPSRRSGNRAYQLMTMSTGFWLFSIVSFVYLQLKQTPVDIFWLFVCIGVSAASNYFIWLRKGRYEQIVEEFQNEPGLSNLAKMLSWVFIFSAFAFFAYVAVYNNSIREAL